MDFAERGAIEKTFDTVLTDQSNGLQQANEDGTDDLLAGSGELSSAGRLYTSGILIGMLTTIRSFADEATDFTEEDATEIDQIVARREREMAQRLAGQEPAEQPQD